jgi:RecA/RadA recombinase
MPPSDPSRARGVCPTTTIPTVNNFEAAPLSSAPHKAVPHNPYTFKRQSSSSAIETTDNILDQSLRVAPAKRRWTFSDSGETRRETSSSSRRIRAPATALTLLHAARAASRSDPLFLMARKQQQPTSTESLDWLQLHDGMIHELSGPAGTGKTQIALSLCVQAASASPTVATTGAGENANVPIRAVYLALGATRLHHVLQRLRTMTSRDSASSIHVLQGILTKCCVSIEDLLPLLTRTLPTLLRQEPNIRLVVLDSIANLLRHDARTPAQRASLLFQVTAAMQSLVSVHCSKPLSILVLNQVTAEITSTSHSSSESWKPALGLSWEHCIHSRFHVHRRERWIQSENGNGQESRNRSVVFDRSLHLVHSNRYPQSSTAFSIDTTGCFLLREA